MDHVENDTSCSRLVGLWGNRRLCGRGRRIPSRRPLTWRSWRLRAHLRPWATGWPLSPLSGPSRRKARVSSWPELVRLSRAALLPLRSAQGPDQGLGPPGQLLPQMGLEGREGLRLAGPHRPGAPPYTRARGGCRQSPLAAALPIFFASSRQAAPSSARRRFSTRPPPRPCRPPRPDATPAPARAACLPGCSCAPER